MLKQPRAHAFLVVPLLALTLFLVGCPKRPATTVAVAPAPAAPMAAPAAPAPAPAPAMPAAPAPAAPAPAPAPMVRPSEFAPNPNLKTIYFDFDKYDIRPNDAKTLDGKAAWLKTNADNLVLIEGNCDERGTAEYNLALGEKRAKAAMNYLVAQGIQASRITIISYGKERPVCTEKTEACWGQNRRDNFLTKTR
jgi:peptidoglycan-associated lipoprotein